MFDNIFLAMHNIMIICLKSNYKQLNLLVKEHPELKEDAHCKQMAADMKVTYNIMMEVLIHTKDVLEQIQRLTTK